MISVLIPIYNFDIRPLVHALLEQCRAGHIEFEILCMDDGSEPHFRRINGVVSKLDRVIYRENELNIGRSAIRNQLADQAAFPYLIFMDCDSRVVGDHYIQTYIDHLDPEALLYGGRIYSPAPPQDRSLLFHWTYGREREQAPVEQRRKDPWQAFMTNNFLIPGKLFQRIRFDERLTQYGHEDTLFGLELKRQMIRVVHLDNPLEHLGLEPVDRFLEKTKKGLENLYFLWRAGSGIDTKLLRVFVRLKRWKFAAISRRGLAVLHPFMLRNFYSAKPDMTLFDLYKLYLLLEEDHKKG